MKKRDKEKFKRKWNSKKRKLKRKASATAKSRTSVAANCGKRVNDLPKDVNLVHLNSALDAVYNILSLRHNIELPSKEEYQKIKDMIVLTQADTLKDANCVTAVDSTNVATFDKSKDEVDGRPTCNKSSFARKNQGKYLDTEEENAETDSTLDSDINESVGQIDVDKSEVNSSDAFEEDKIKCNGIHDSDTKIASSVIVESSLQTNEDYSDHEIDCGQASDNTSSESEVDSDQEDESGIETMNVNSEDESDQEEKSYIETENSESDSESSDLESEVERDSTTLSEKSSEDEQGSDTETVKSNSEMDSDHDEVKSEDEGEDENSWTENELTEEALESDSEAYDENIDKRLRNACSELDSSDDENGDIHESENDNSETDNYFISEDSVEKVSKTLIENVVSDSAIDHCCENKDKNLKVSKSELNKRKPLSDTSHISNSYSSIMKIPFKNQSGNLLQNILVESEKTVFKTYVEALNQEKSSNPEENRENIEICNSFISNSCSSIMNTQFKRQSGKLLQNILVKNEKTVFKTYVEALNQEKSSNAEENRENIEICNSFISNSCSSIMNTQFKRQSGNLLQNILVENEKTVFKTYVEALNQEKCSNPEENPENIEICNDMPTTKKQFFGTPNSSRVGELQQVLLNTNSRQPLIKSGNQSNAHSVISDKANKKMNSETISENSKESEATSDSSLSEASGQSKTSTQTNSQKKTYKRIRKISSDSSISKASGHSKTSTQSNSRTKTFKRKKISASDISGKTSPAKTKNVNSQTSTDSYSSTDSSSDSQTSTDSYSSTDSSSDSENSNQSNTSKQISKTKTYKRIRKTSSLSTDSSSSSSRKPLSESRENDEAVNYSSNESLSAVTTSLEVIEISSDEVESGNAISSCSRDLNLDPSNVTIKEEPEEVAARKPRKINGRPALRQTQGRNPHKVDVDSVLQSDDLASRGLRDVVRLLDDDAGYVEDDDMGAAETYEAYMPSKLNIDIQHPSKVVETVSLASVESVDVTYELSLLRETMAKGCLSALQLEAVVYACQAHERAAPNDKRQGFLIGDGAGVGKGRTIAGIIYENYLRGRRKAIWISIANDLHVDARRDLDDIGAHSIRVHVFKDTKYGPLPASEGVMFVTYTALASAKRYKDFDDDYNTRLKQLVKWVGEEFEGCIIFDECHKAKNLWPANKKAKPTLCGASVVWLQERLPRARVVYASATGASEPRHLAYMTRLGLWAHGTDFDGVQELVNSVENRGVGAMEIVAMDMKLRGVYIARQLSFEGVTFNIDEVPMKASFKQVYNDAVAMWVRARHMFKVAADDACLQTEEARTMWGQFWSSHQRFFKNMCIAAKVHRVIEIVERSLGEGKSVVIGLQSTGEAALRDELTRSDEHVTHIVSTAACIFRKLVENYFPGFEDDTSDEEHIGESRGGARRRRPNKRRIKKAFKKAAKRFRSGTSTESYYTSENETDHPDSSVTKRTHSDADADVASADDNGGTNRKEIMKDTITTNESYLNGASTSFDSSFTGLDTIVNQFCNSFVCEPSIEKKMSATKRGHNPPSKADLEKVYGAREELLAKVEELGKRLPPNPLDLLIDGLGGPDKVAEMTGRKSRIVRDQHGNVTCESRSERKVRLDDVNLTERKRFMDGVKRVAIISDAASSGISLHGDTKAKNQQRRVHITLELPWAADKAIQQFGRTHRSNQAQAPQYIFVISDLGGERRFASSVAKRLESLGALTHGDRRATESRDLSQFNIDNKYGHIALRKVLLRIKETLDPSKVGSKVYNDALSADIALRGVGLEDVCDSSSPNMDKQTSKFLNRILGMPVDVQNWLFGQFIDEQTSIVEKAKCEGTYDQGIFDLGSAGERVCRTGTTRYILPHVAVRADKPQTADSADMPQAVNRADMLQTTDRADVPQSADDVDMPLSADRTDTPHTADRADMLQAAGRATVLLHTFVSERGTSCEEALQRLSLHPPSPHIGFYTSRDGRSLELVLPAKPAGDEEPKFYIYKPHTGRQLQKKTLRSVQARLRKLHNLDFARVEWTQRYRDAETKCKHATAGSNRNCGPNCQVGRRRRDWHVLSGSVLAVWHRLVALLAGDGADTRHKLQVVRVQLQEGGERAKRIVGVLIPNHLVSTLHQELEKDAQVEHLQLSDKAASEQSRFK